MTEETKIIKDEQASLNYLKKFKFEKHLKNLNKKLKDKTIVLYGAGIFLEAINKHYDLSNLNIIGVCDKRFDGQNPEQTFLGYKTYSLNEVKILKPDYILVSTKFYTNIIEDLHFNVFRKSDVTIKPLVKKGFLTLLKEIWGE